MWFLSKVSGVGVGARFCSRTAAVGILGFPLLGKWSFYLVECVVSVLFSGPAVTVLALYISIHRVSGVSVGGFGVCKDCQAE